jgi:hypothetical protein
MDLSIIIPVHEYNETVEKYLKTALDSIKNQEGANNSYPAVVIVAATESVKNNIDELVSKSELPFVPQTLTNDQGSTSFQGQVNFGVSKINTKYFTILEFDDELSIKFLKNYNVYTTAYPNVDLFMPIIVEVNEENRPLKLTNEPVWSKQFVGENGVIGYLNARALSQYTDFKIAGSIFKTEEYKSNGMLKTKIDLTFNYELLLRYVNMGSKIFVMPKTIYKHVVTRPDSLFAKYATTMTLKERKFWFETAKKESNFNTDRDINKSELLVSAQ